jgi:gluconate 2-dehydrogenase gamma chain
MTDTRAGAEEPGPDTRSQRSTSDGDGNGSGGALSRRQLLAAGGAAVAGGAIGLGAGLLIADDKETGESQEAAAQPTHALEALTADQAAILSAVLARLIPSDDSGPGAEEAMVWRYIDRALAGDLKEMLPLYSDGLAGLDAYARQTQGSPFTELTPEQQDEVLAALEAGEADGFPGDPQAFFNTLHSHAMEGMFGDPAHGGNAGFAGWKLIGYPGVRLAWSPSDMELDATPGGERHSTYEFSNFGAA